MTMKPKWIIAGAAALALALLTLPMLREKRGGGESLTASGPVPAEGGACDQTGKGTFDFSEFQVQSVHIEANRTKVEVEFASQNPIVLESFFASVPAGSLRFQHLLNARAKQVTLDVPGAVCQLEVVGAESEGESVINLQGVPSEMKVVVSRKVGVRVTGPPATAAHFAAPHMAQAGEDWTSQGYEAAKCRVRFTFAEDVPKLEVAWK